jgi:murein DD-endopeptidase MepM/ murein hydrolase activator NlpD
MRKLCFYLLHLFAFILILSSCTTPGPSGLFGKRTPHEIYSGKLADAGLKETALGRLWFAAADNSLTGPLSITTPYSEAGYFAADKPGAAAVRFKARRGEKLNITLTKKPAAGFSIYMDLWELPADNNKPALLTAADTVKSSISFEVKRDGFYIVRLQPELLASGEYTLSISTGPSLAFPVPAKAKPRIQSFWGAARDNGGRKHEGIDIFAPFRTPLVAAADGTVTNVSENELGGKVVFFRPYDKDYTLYYAHLDEQLVTSGQSLKTGDTLGLMGNTGNARTTSPHLHFGIYTNGGAINPLAFVDPVEKKPVNITAPLTNLGKYVRSDDRSLKVYGEPSATPSNNITLENNTAMRVLAASAGWYKVALPDGQQGYIQSGAVTSLKPLRKVVVNAIQPLLDSPATEAARKLSMEKGATVNVLASFKDYYYVSAKDDEGWIPKTSLNAK